jgi:hypothetical protein
MTFSYKILRNVAVLMLLLMAGCNESPTETVPEEDPGEQPGFTGSVSGAVSGDISGPGVATYLPPQDTIDGVRTGYYLMANDRGTREILTSFRIPAGTKPGTYELVEADPMELGETFEIRVETLAGGTLTSFGFNTEGTLTLEAFPPDGTKLSGAKIKGSFQFTTQDADGESLSGKGTFEFLG